jgi:hypothetical protein
MGLPPLLEEVRKRPAMFLSKVDFDVLAGFLEGYHLAGNGGLLVGFREWLIVKLGYGNNLTWPGLVLRLLFPGAESPGKCHLESNDQQRAVEFLFELLEEYWRERQAYDGMRRIFLQYEEWLKQQDWYGPESPQYIDGTVKRHQPGKKRQRKPA